MSPKPPDATEATRLASMRLDDMPVTEVDPPASLDEPELPGFPVGSLPAVLEDLVRAVAEDTQTPPDMAAVLSLAAVAACVQGRITVEPKPGYVEPTSLFVAVALGSGERKSAVIQAITRPIAMWERNVGKKLAPQVERDREQRAATVKRIEWLRTASAKCKDADERDATIDEAARLSARLAEPELTYPRIICDDVTPEALVRVMASQLDRAAIFSPEGGLFNQLAGQYSTVPNTDVYLKGHAGERIRVDRRSGEPIALEHPALTMGLAIQPDVLRDLVNNAKFRGVGLVARYLFALPKSRVGMRLVDSAAVPEHVRDRYQSLIFKLLDQRDGEPQVLRLSTEARAVWKDAVGKVEARMAPGAELSHVRDWASKSTGLILRIAGLLHAASDSVDFAYLSEDAMSSAVRIVLEYATPHALAAFGGVVDPERDAARAVWDWINTQNVDFVYARQVHTALRGQRRFNCVDSVNRALKFLLKDQYLSLKEAPLKPGAGRPRSPAYTVRKNTQNTQNPSGSVR